MQKFRIKKEEKGNGECQWTPQVGTPRLTLGRYLYLKLDWENILDKSFATSKTQKYYRSEEQALQIIEEFKQYKKEQDSKKVVKVSYKNL